VEETMLITRRQALKSTACGFGYLAFAGLASSTAQAARHGDPLAPKTPHHAARAKRVIFIFMQGGPSHVDSFDWKPSLVKNDGKMFAFDDARTLAKTKKIIEHRVMKPLWKFSQHGQSGQWASELFPQIAAHSDDLCFLRGMHTEGIAHGPATL